MSREQDLHAIGPALASFALTALAIVPCIVLVRAERAARAAAGSESASDDTQTLAEAAA